MPSLLREQFNVKITTGGGFISNPVIFVRERIKVNKGDKTPRFAVVAVAGTDLKIYAKHIRKAEAEQIAAEIGASLVYLKRGKENDSEDNLEIDDFLD